MSVQFKFDTAGEIHAHQAMSVDEFARSIKFGVKVLAICGTDTTKGYASPCTSETWSSPKTRRAGRCA